ncbi:hypothetical protein [Sphingomonas sp.]|uniref:hypothetical protein n=1 Tax=Sphingomonas sp. TaxID=28214 RepID=UPI003CC5EA20
MNRRQAGSERGHAIDVKLLFGAILLLAAPPAGGRAQSMPGMPMPGMPMPPAPARPPTPDRPEPAMAAGGMAMTGALGPYSMTRDASGTAWQPDASPMQGVMRMSGHWTLMSQATLNGVYDRQNGPRGDSKAFVSGMVMGMATGNLSLRDTVQFRAMLSPDPLMGRRGYPLLLAAGETANGRDPLIDRQHPHDLIMELAASYSRRLGGSGSAFVYIGLPGEPAFGPGAFMHRLSIMDSPEAPITHHWFDSTHITFGVVTVGATYGGVKLEASRFKGREPDQHRYDIEKPRFDSIAIRASWNPARTLALQASWMRLHSPEQLTPEEDQERLSASAIYTRPIGRDGYVSVTAAWGRKTEIEADGYRGGGLDAYLLEAAVKPDRRWTVFARAERIDTDELLPARGGVHGAAFTVGKASIGAIRDFRVANGPVFGVGALVARSFTPDRLAPSLGGDRTSGMAFVRFRL